MNFTSMLKRFRYSSRTWHFSPRVSAVARQAPPVYLNGAHITEQNDDLPEKAELVTSTLVTLRPRYSSIQPQSPRIDCQVSITIAKPN